MTSTKKPMTWRVCKCGQLEYVHDAVLSTPDGGETRLDHEFDWNGTWYNDQTPDQAVRVR